MAIRRSPASLSSTRRGARAEQRRPGQSSHVVLHLDACPWPAPRQGRRRDGIPARPSASRGFRIVCGFCGSKVARDPADPCSAGYAPLLHHDEAVSEKPRPRVAPSHRRGQYASMARYHARRRSAEYRQKGPEPYPRSVSLAAGMQRGLLRLRCNTNDLAHGAVRVRCLRASGCRFGQLAQTARRAGCGNASSHIAPPAGGGGNNAVEQMALHCRWDILHVGIQGDLGITLRSP